MELTEGTKVFVRDDFGKEYKGEIVNVSNYRETSMKYAVDLDDLDLDDYVFVGEEQIRISEGADDEQGEIG